MKQILIIGILLVTTGLLSACSKEKIENNKEKPQIIEKEISKKSTEIKNAEVNSQIESQDFVFEKKSFDFGKIKQSGGTVSYDFKFIYNGSQPITVTGVPTSCACTSAEISKNTFQPGESGIVTVYFNPNLHGEPQGRFFKSISLLTEPKLEEIPEIKIWTEIDLDLGEEAFELQAIHVDNHDDYATKTEGEESSVIEKNIETITVDQTSYQAETSEGGTDFLALNINNFNFNESNSKIDDVFERVDLDSTKLQVILVSSNHGYSYADIDYINSIKLSGINPESFKIIKSKMGGHHVTTLLNFAPGIKMDTLEFNDSPVGNIILQF